MVFVRLDQGRDALGTALDTQGTLQGWGEWAAGQSGKAAEVRAQVKPQLQLASPWTWTGDPASLRRSFLSSKMKESPHSEVRVARVTRTLERF